MTLALLLVLLAAPPDAGTPKPKAPPSAIEPTDSKDEEAVHKLPALEQHLRSCVAKAFPESSAPKGCLPVLIGTDKKGALTFTIDRERPSLRYDDGEKCLRTYAGAKPSIKKGSKLRVPVCF
ncbi:MAG: hypothetical protein QM723_11835 [Myxococcaceae bacterium]